MVIRTMVMYRDSPSGPWIRLWLDLDLIKFTEAKSPDKYVKSLVQLHVMGGNYLDVSYKLTLDAAKKLIKNTKST
jgi:hypothetical protein